MAEGAERLASSVQQLQLVEDAPLDQPSLVDWSKFSLRNAELLRTVGTGTFGRVMVIREKNTDEYFALKILVIDDVMRLKQVEHVKNEKAILNTVSHPFLVKLYWTNHDIKFLYMVFEFVCGGEIFSYLRTSGTFSNAATLFYAAEILSAIMYLHDMSVVYRDLKPENLLLDARGHLKITDFGFAKVLKDRTYTMCGTPEYLAPEIIMGKGYNRAVDYWALGVLIYEMLVGTPPFYDDSPMQIYQKILNGRFEFPVSAQADPQARDLVRKLLVQDRTKRLGNMKSGAEDVRSHRWFRGLDWDQVYSRKLAPPIVPQVQHPGDTSCYDKYEEQDWKRVPSSSAIGQEYFRDF
ncbi:hypothetical protein BOX15_Mlig000304g2 [Macrostomum lignano]|uniref:Protein kinase domain-containing protein n=1 Tax=Macrostomum lignano TaxID=282301 RepID=A0A267GL64_9PLAT|nr:hypothetical protein BOX15_Mlig000304g2 [Macrostomum lignano]